MSALIVHDRRKLASLALIPLALACIALFTILDLRTPSEPPYLLAILNTLFIGIIPLIISFIAFRSYRAGGLPGLFTLGAGMLIFGLGSIAAGWLIGFPGGTNDSVTVYNVCILASGIFYLAGSFLTFAGDENRSTPVPLQKTVAGTAAITVFVIVLIVLTIAGFVPPFFIAGTGPTVLRQVVLSNAIVILTIASLVLFRVFTRKREDFFFWYAVALMVIAVGLVGAVLTPALGSPVNWVSRLMQYLGAGFALAAILVARRQALAQGSSLNETLSRFFSSADAGYRSLIETASEGIWITDTDGKITFVNRRMADMTGYSPEEMIGKPVSDFLDQKERGTAEKNPARQKQGLKTSFEEKIIRRDGTVLWVISSTSPLRDRDGQVSGLLGMLTDITERKRAEEELSQKNTDLTALNEELRVTQEELHRGNDALARSERELGVKNAQLQALFDSSSASLVLFDAVKPYTVLAHNRYSQQLFREPFRSQGLVGTNLTDFVPEAEVPGVMEVYDDVVATRQARTLVHFPFDGTERGRTYWNWHLSPVIQGGEVVALAHMGIDVTNEVTARLKVEEAVAALRESEELLRIAEQGADAGAWDWDIVSGALKWSPALFSLFGIDTADGASFDAWKRAIHPEDRDPAAEKVDRAVEERTPLNSEYRVIHPDGQVRWINSVGTTFCDPAGKPLRMAGFCFDITERKRAEALIVQNSRTLSDLIEGAPFGIYVIDSGFRIAMMNAGSQTGAFRNVRPLIGRDFREAMHILWPDTIAEEIVASFRHTLETGEPYYSPHFTNPRHDTEIVESYEWELHRMTLPDGGYGVICYYFDSTRLRNAEAALRESEERFRVFMDNSPALAWMKDEQGRYVYLNKAYRERFRADAGEWLGKTDNELWPPEVARQFIANDRIILETGQAIQVTEETPTPGGRPASWLNAKFLLTDPAGRKFVGGIGIDISNRRQAEESLRRSEEQFRNIVETANEGIIIVDPESRITYSNTKFAEMLGRAPEELTGKNVIEYFDRDSVPLALEKREQRKRSGTRDSYEARFIRADGSPVWGVVNSSPLFDRNGEFAGSLGMVTDITSRRQAEDALRESEERYRTLFENMHEGFALCRMIYDEERHATDFIYIAVNRAFGRITGQETVTGKPVTEVYPGIRASFPWLFETYGRVTRTGNPEQFEIDFTPAGKWLHISVYSPAADHFVAIFEDITDRKRAEGALRESEERLRLAQEAANVGVWDWNLLTQNVMFMPELEAIYGRTPGSVRKYEDFQAQVLPGDLAIIEAMRDKAVEEHRAFEFEFRIRRPDGEIRWIFCRGSAVYGENGEPERIFGINLDVTRRREADERIRNLLDEVRREKDRLSSLICSIGDEVWFAGPDKTFTLANPSALREFALGDGAVDIETLAASLLVLRPDGSPRDVGESPPLRALEGEVIRNQEEMIRTPGHGEIRYRQVSANPVRDASGTIIGSVAVVRDITEQKRAEEELKRKNEDLGAAFEEIAAKEEELHRTIAELSLRENALNKALEEKEILLSEIHHRVKNNLTAFISLLSLEGSTESTPEGRELRKDLQNRARSMALIHETLYRTQRFSEVAMDEYLEPLIEQVVSSYGAATTIRTVVEAKGVFLDLARATPAGLIINELVTNALRHAFPWETIASRAEAGDPCKITIRLVKENSSYLLSVADNGTGLPAGFESGTAKSLGLKLVNFLSKHQLQGTVEVRSGKGTEFLIRFPE